MSDWNGIESFAEWLKIWRRNYRRMRTREIAISLFHHLPKVVRLPVYDVAGVLRIERLSAEELSNLLGYFIALHFAMQTTTSEKDDDVAEYAQRAVYALLKQMRERVEDKGFLRIKNGAAGEPWGAEEYRQFPHRLLTFFACPASYSDWEPHRETARVLVEAFASTEINRNQWGNLWVSAAFDWPNFQMPDCRDRLIHSWITTASWPELEEIIELKLEERFFQLLCDASNACRCQSDRKYPRRPRNLWPYFSAYDAEKITLAAFPLGVYLNMPRTDLLPEGVVPRIQYLR